MSEQQDTVTLTIDGKEVTVAKGTLIIRAAEQLGVIIPRFCDHPLLDPVGACRQCVVEVEGQPKPAMACTTQCGDGWTVRTHLTSEVARKAQRGTIEFLLINHPLDCPMCDKGGECPLQDQALEHGSNESRFIDQKRRYDKPVAVNPQVLLDRERCVLCARCTRFSDQISGDPFIELFERGALEQVAIYEDEPYESYFSGNVIQICPVGALTSSTYRFKARPFDLRSAKSVCEHCSAGCNLTVQSRRGKIERQLARTNMDVNEMWTCDRGRFGFGYLTADTRLTSPAVRSGGDLQDTSWADALKAVRAAVSTEDGLKRVAVLSGGRLADEDAYVASKLARTVLMTDDVEFRTRFAPVDETDALAALVTHGSATYADVENAPVVLTVGLDAEEEVPILHLRLRKAWRNRKARLVAIGARMGSLAPYAWRHLQTGVGDELGALAAVGRGLGLSDLAGTAVASGFASPHLDAVVDELRGRTGAVILVGERAPAGALATAGRIADHIGGKVAWVPRRANARGAVDAGLAAGLLPGGRRLDDDADRAEIAEAWGAQLPASGRDLHAILTDAAAGKIDVLYLLGVDLARDAADPALAVKALKRATVIVQDLAHNETTQYADVVLPVTASQERSGTRTDWEGRKQRFDAALSGPELVQDDWEILVQVAGLLGGDLGFHDLDGLRAELQQLGTRSSAAPWPTIDANERNEPSGDGLVLQTYPVLLDRGTMLAGADDLLRSARPARISIAAADAADRGIADGDVVEVTGTVTLRLPVTVDPHQRAGTIYVPANSTDDPAAALGTAADGPIAVEVASAAVEVGS